jgi:hypothetical protein
MKHLASAAAGFLAPVLLSEGEGHRLVGVGQLALISLGLTALIPVLMALLEPRLRARAQPL